MLFTIEDILTSTPQSNKSIESVNLSQNQLQGHFGTRIVKGIDVKVVRENP